MLFRTVTGTLVNVERCTFTSDREYFMYIKYIVTGKPIQSTENIVDRLTNIIIQK